MNTVPLKFGKDKTAIIKGIAILMMILLHCCCGPGWYDKEIPALQNASFVAFINGSLKICVAIYAFLVGFGYSFCKDRDIRYSLKHIWKLLVPYWIILLGLSLPFCNKEIGWEGIILSMFGIEGSLSWVYWFVYFYIFQMLTLPILTRIIDKKPFLLTLFFMMGFLGIKGVMHFYHIESNIWTDAVSACCIYSPIVLEGYLFGKEKLFTRITLPANWPMVIAASCTIVFVPIFRSFGLSFVTEWVMVPVFIIAVLYLFTAYELPVSSKILSACGNNSVYMWFVHGLFFTGTIRWFWQRFILISDNLVIISLWTIVLTFGVSWVLKTLVDSFSSKIPIKW